ncbi:MAG: iron ABC transporter permease [Pseudomonadales bacterium]|nr:iron ABC transporter permease [Pseudomonadales bacterium]
MKSLYFNVIVFVAVTLLVVVLLVAMMIGPSHIESLALFQILLNIIFETQFSGVFVDIASWQQTVVYQVRLPRVIIAALVGASLSLSGAVLQGLFRNPLASPSILGVSSGASLGAIIAIFLGLAASNMWSLPLFAFIGAGVTLLFVYRIATHRGHAPIGTLLLSGVAVGSFNVAMSSLIIALAMQEWEVGRTIVFWTMGGLDGRGWYHVLLLLPVFLFSLVVILSYKRDLDILLVGEVHANAVGVDVEKVRKHLLLVAALLTGCSVSIAGGIGFVGLIVPHITRLLVGPHHRRLLPITALLGAIILVLADLLIRGNESYASIPLGVVTGTMGAPFFLFLLLKQRKIMQA